MISKNLAQRLIVAAIACPAIIFLVFAGGDIFLYFILLLAGIGLWEYLRAEGVPVSGPLFWVPMIGVLSAVYFSARGLTETGLWSLLIVFLLVGTFLATGRDPIDVLYRKMVSITWGSFYLGLLYPFLFRIRGEAGWLEPAPGRWRLFYLIGALWIGDTAAMAVGKYFGKRKLAPAVSPGKTVEGFLGGYAGILLVSIVFKLFWMPELLWLHYLALTVIIGTFGQLGDLVESLWKRAAGLKDSSAVIPGHGGVLDRFDSLIYSAPVVYFYLKYAVSVVCP